MMSRIPLFTGVMVTLAALTSARAASPAAPSIVILLADDLGYGDLGCYGHPTIRTPNVDRMAAEGLRFTQYYAWCYCTPSRAALLTGRLPVRSGLNRVLGPSSTGGISHGEITLGQALKSRGYATMCIGKWHLGHHAEFLPTRHGFDQYFGIPYSNDMDRPKQNEPPIPLMRDEATVEQPAVQETLTKRYTEEALRFIHDHADGARQGRPFFLICPTPFLTFHFTPARRSGGRARAGCTAMSSRSSTPVLDRSSRPFKTRSWPAPLW